MTAPCFWLFITLPANVMHNTKNIGPRPSRWRRVQTGTAEVLVAKHRTGPTGKTRLAFIKHHTRFANMARTA